MENHGQIDDAKHHVSRTEPDPETSESAQLARRA